MLWIIIILAILAFVAMGVLGGRMEKRRRDEERKAFERQYGADSTMLEARVARSLWEDNLEQTLATFPGNEMAAEFRENPRLFCFGSMIMQVIYGAEATASSYGAIQKHNDYKNLRQLMNKVVQRRAEELNLFLATDKENAICAKEAEPWVQTLRESFPRSKMVLALTCYVMASIENWNEALETASALSKLKGYDVLGKSIAQVASSKILDT